MDGASRLRKRTERMDRREAPIARRAPRLFLQEAYGPRRDPRFSRAGIADLGRLCDIMKIAAFWADTRSLAWRGWFQAMERDADVATRAKTIEWLKTEVVDQVSRLFKAMWDGSAVRITDSLAGLIAGVYILGRRLGISYKDLDGAVTDKLAKLKQEGHQLEDLYRDLSALEEHIRKR